MTPDPQCFAVDPQRLESGHWCHRSQKTIAQGDISASYSADRIGMDQPVRKPFTWRGAPHVCTGKRYCHGKVTAEAYRLVHPSVFDGETRCYAGVIADGENARRSSRGFYHGMRVKHAGQAFVLSGPPLSFTQGEAAQMALF